MSTWVATNAEPLSFLFLHSIVQSHLLIIYIKNLARTRHYNLFCIIFSILSFSQLTQWWTSNNSNFLLNLATLRTSSFNSSSPMLTGFGRCQRRCWSWWKHSGFQGETRGQVADRWMARRRPHLRYYFFFHFCKENQEQRTSCCWGGGEGEGGMGVVVLLIWWAGVRCHRASHLSKPEMLGTSST